MERNIPDNDHYKRKLTNKNISKFKTQFHKIEWGTVLNTDLALFDYSCFLLHYLHTCFLRETNIQTILNQLKKYSF